MKIEILYNELCNLFGDSANVSYLEKSLPKAKFIYTSINDKPSFISEDVSLVYMGPMTENTQELVINKLLPYKKEIEANIKKGTNFLVTGNAVEVFGKYIENEDGSRISGLGIFDIYAKRDMMHRYNVFVLGTFNSIEMVGFKSQFTQLYGDESKYFIDVVRGTGFNQDSKHEGVKVNNFIGTYLLGPILILNPLFTHYLFDKMGCPDTKLVYEDEAMDAYKQRLIEFKDMNRELN